MNLAQFKNQISRHIDRLASVPSGEWADSDHSDMQSLIGELYEVALQLRLPQASLLLGENPPRVKLCELLESLEDEPGEMLSPSDVADMLGISADKVLAWCNEGFLKAANINNSTRPRWVITRQNLSEFLESRERQPQPQRTATRRY